jgi:hypothetical protein
MKTMPLCAQSTIYNNGFYNQTTLKDGVNHTIQSMTGTTIAEGLYNGFMAPYKVLTNLSNMTYVTENESNTFLFLSNDTTHEPMMLQEPEYTPAEKVDNTQYDAEHTKRFTVDGRTLNMSSQQQVIHYQTNMAALMQLGKWFDYLRENDVYDNTKIIIVADHGRPLFHFDELVLGTETDEARNVEFYYPLLLVKDFQSAGFTVSDEFMTNADVPTLATEGLIDNPTNPFTGKAISSSEKTAHDQYVIVSTGWDIEKNDGNTFLPARWASVKDNRWDKDNWTFYEKEVVLDEYSFPE